MHKTIAEVLAELMAEDLDSRGKPISQNELARQTGISQPTILRILNGQSLDPDTATLAPIARYFGITTGQLRGEEPVIRNTKIRRVVSAMERMSEYQKDAMVKMGDTIVEPVPDDGEGKGLSNGSNGQ